MSTNLISIDRLGFFLKREGLLPFLRKTICSGDASSIGPAGACILMNYRVRIYWPEEWESCFYGKCK